jgi:transcriptional regulator with XRE-family HTH domain
MSHLPSAFGLVLRQMRERHDWSQEALAANAGLNRSFVGELERGQAIASLITVEKLAFAFGVSVTTLVSNAERISSTQTLQGIELTSIAC